MAEVKNAFIKSKMNKDLDSRLLPSGEYRDGQNIQVSKSEGEDVGALENAVGNVLAVTSSGIDVDFSVLCGLDSGTLESIGVYADTNSANIFVFLTDFGSTDTSIVDPVYLSSANNVIFSYNVLTKNTNKLVQGAFLNFSKRNPIYGINLLENLLFWTDNRNQPRKINLDRAGAIEPYYTTEDTLSVAKYNPHKAIELYYQDTAAKTPIGNSNPNQGQYVTSCQDVVSQFLPNDQTQVNNMYYNPLWPGDPDYLEDKFVSFSYRFEFIDGEYSIMAPFTQEAFIPKQDGYFLEGDENDTYRSTIVRFMENKVNDVGVYIPLPFSSTGEQLSPSTFPSSLSVKSIDILYKESDSLTVRVLDSIPCDLAFRTLADLETLNTDSFYEYNYQSRKPYKTLPESDIVRVYDKVPVRAFGQEIISNRVVYSNFQDKHTPPATIDYDVAVTSKSSFSLNGNQASWNTSIIEYPEHTVKQNRNYQVGFVLSDRFGRQSTTILSPVGAATQTDPNGIVYGGSTFYHPYTANPGTGNNYINNWPGDSIKVLINKAIDTSLANQETGWPGLYNGNAASDLYNPLGWYSYKIVVKQTEQEYYNVYLPGILNGYPDFGSQQTPPDPENSIAHITLIGDNINKVPRDLTEVGPEQRQYRSDVKLYGRVTPDRSVTPVFTSPYYPQTNPQLPVAIAEQDYIFTDADTDSPYATVYQSDSDPYISRLSQGRVSTAAGTTLPSPIGSLQSTGTPGSVYNILLGVFETNPVESLLDIFWETSTTGLIKDLNDIAGTSNVISGFVGFDFIQTEATQAGDFAIKGFAPAIETGLGLQAIQSTMVLESVFANGADVTANWDAPVLQPNQLIFYNLVVKVPMYYETTLAKNNFTFTFLITDVDGNTSSRVVSNIRLKNVEPEITTPSISPFTINISNPRNTETPFFSFKGVNGSTGLPETGATDTQDLAWSFYNNGIFSQVFESSPPLYINAQSGEITEPTGQASGNFNFKVAVRDSGNAIDEVEIKAVFGQEQMNDGFGKAKDFTQNGLTSFGVYWCESDDYEDVITSEPLPEPVSNTQDEGRVPFEGLENININANGAKLVTLSPDQQENKDTEGSIYAWNNNNYNSKFSSLGGVASPSGLEAGTAYVKLDLIFKSWPYLDIADSGGGQEDFGNNSIPLATKQIGVAWPIYLQYRENAQSDWVTAVDVEGQDVLFGSTNTSSNLYSGVFADTGFVSNFNQSSVQAAPINEQANVSEVTTTFPQNGSVSATTAIASKVFVFGKDQSINSTSEDKLGDYRLLIRYPQNNTLDERGPGSTAVVPVNVQIRNPLFGTAGASKVNGNIKSRLSFGDFYYPDGNNSPTSYGYLISANGGVDADVASDLTPNVAVFAREWAFKYVSKFYTNPDLSTEYTETQNGSYHSYSGINNTDNNVKIGTENSFISKNNSFDTNTNILTDKTNLSRRWVAKFNGSGEKEKGTARPTTQTARV